jgi:hypothetical protein
LPTQSGRVYQLQSKDSLAETIWLAAPLVAGTVGGRWFADFPTTSTQRFYRVLRW